MPKILNPTDGKPKALDAPESKKVAADLRTCLFSLFSAHIDEKDGKVNYITLSKTPEFKDFVSKTQRLAGCQPQHLTEDERKAFFINLYNILTIHALADLHANRAPGEQIESPCSIPDFWTSYAYVVGGNSFTSDDIEHGILRGNKIHPTNKQHVFKEGDPRLSLSLENLDPRIHFALNCGAMSCPMAKVYSSDKLNEQLDAAARGYLKDELKITTEPSSKIIVPQILEWYNEDFGANLTQRLQYIAKFVAEDKRTLLEKLLEKIEDVQIEYEHDWSLNHKE